MTEPYIPLGAFHLHKCIGKGGMGEVWRGVHVRQGLKVAAKFMTSAVARDPRYVKAFHNEVRAVAGLQHAGIVMVFDHGEVSAEAEEISGGRLVAGSPYLVMEWASGGHLGRIKYPLMWPEIKGVLVSLLDALGHAHARGVIHRDIKPPNLLISTDKDARPGVKLTDFGIAHAMHSHEEALSVETTAGTPAYMAPEQIMGLWRDFGPWTDLYAIGCIAHMLACGAPPFTGSAKKIAHDQLRERPAVLMPRVKVPRGLGAWVARLLEKSPDQRFQRAADATWALHALDEGQSRPPYGLLDTPRSASAPPAAALDVEETILDAAPQSPPTVMLQVSARPETSKGDVPPMPRSWRAEKEARPPLALVGAGLGLFGLRAAPMVGRTSERDAVWRALTEVKETGRARLVLLKGPAGVGKSRLAEWMCQRAHEVGATTVLKAFHSPADNPQAGLSRMVARHLRCIGLDRAVIRSRAQAFLDAHGVSDRAEAEALTELISPASEDERAVSFGAPTERYALIERFIAKLAGVRPVVVWLDDVQWGRDALTFSMYALQRQLGAHCPVLFLMTARTDIADFDQGVLAETLLMDTTTSLHIGPLGAADRGALVQGLLGLEQSLAAQVEARSGGNPLFAVQLVGDWVRREVLEISERGFVLREGEEAQLPDDIHQVWASRLAHLLSDFPTAASAPLELAAVLGMEVKDEEWRKACDSAALSVEDGLMSALFRDGLALPIPEGWCFMHGMLRESLLRMGRESGRIEGHHRAAVAALEVLYSPHTPGVAERVGQHLFGSGDFERALSPLMEAAEKYRARGEFAEALRLLALRDEALTGLGADEEDMRRASGWLASTSIDLIQGRYNKTRQNVERIRKAAHTHQDQRLAACALVKEAWLARVLDSDMTRAESLLNKALNTFKLIGDLSWQGTTLSDLGNTSLFKNRLDRSEYYFRQSMAIFERLGDEVNYHDALVNLSKTFLADESWEEAATALQTALSFFEKRGQRLVVADILNGLGELRRFQGDLDGAEAAYSRAFALEHALGSHDITTRYNLAIVSMTRGRFDEAHQRFEALREELTRSGERLQLSGIYLGLLPCAASEKDWKAWDNHIERARPYIEANTIERDDAYIAQLAGDLAAAAGQPQRARQAYIIARHWWKHLVYPDKVAEIDAAVAALTP